MQNITIEYAKAKANEQLERHFGDSPVMVSPIDTLTVFPWAPFIQGKHSQEEIIDLNLNLDPRSCLGRIALCFAICDKYYPWRMLHEFGEVTLDWFHCLMMRQWKDVYKSGAITPPDSWFEEFLMYEEPHGVVFVRGTQFDPLQTIMDPSYYVRHPGYLRFDSWSAIASSMTVSQANTLKDPAERLALLAKAEVLCPRTCLVMEAEILPLIQLHRYEHAFDSLLRLVTARPTARTFFVMEECFNDSRRPECIKRYGEILWDHLKAKLESEVVYE